MPVRKIMHERLEPGTIVREGDSVLVVNKVAPVPEGRYGGKWAHDMRAPTYEERLASDVMES